MTRGRELKIRHPCRCADEGVRVETYPSGEYYSYNEIYLRPHLILPSIVAGDDQQLLGRYVVVSLNLQSRTAGSLFSARNGLRSHSSIGSMPTVNNWFMRFLEDYVYALPEPPPRKRTKPMEVLCVGMPRTGTESLQHALLRLGYDHTYHGWDIIYDQPNYAQQWVRLCRKK